MRKYFLFTSETRKANWREQGLLSINSLIMTLYIVRKLTWFNNFLKSFPIDLKSSIKMRNYESNREQSVWQCALETGRLRESWTHIPSPTRVEACVKLTAENNWNWSSDRSIWTIIYARLSKRCSVYRNFSFYFDVKTFKFCVHNLHYKLNLNNIWSRYDFSFLHCNY